MSIAPLLASEAAESSTNAVGAAPPSRPHAAARSRPVVVILYVARYGEVHARVHGWDRRWCRLLKYGGGARCLLFLGMHRKWNARRQGPSQQISEPACARKGAVRWVGTDRAISGRSRRDLTSSHTAHRSSCVSPRAPSSRAPSDALTDVPSGRSRSEARSIHSFHLSGQLMYLTIAACSATCKTFGTERF